MSLDQAVNQRLIINDNSAKQAEVSPSPSSSFSSRSRNPSNTSKSPSPISFLTDGGTGGAISPGSASATSFSLTTTTCQRSSLISSSTTGATSTATVKSSSPTSRTIKFNDSCQTSDGANIPTRTFSSDTLDAMSNHQNNITTTASSNTNTPTSAKPPPSPVKFSNKSKSRHSSASESACVTPTGGGGGGTPASAISGLGPGPDGVDRAHSIRVTRKIFNNWRSACGRTKDKTKDFIRRWKTLPENQADLETSESEFAHHNSPQGSTGNVHSPFSGGGLGNSMEQSGGFAGGIGKDASSSSGLAGESGGNKSSGFGKIKSLTKKFSQDIASEDLSSSSVIPSKPSAGWSVHVWATYVQREMDDEDDLSTKEEEKPGRDLLTEFQKTKLTHFFRHVLDMNHDDVISAADFVALNQRIRHYIEWSPECIEFHVLKEVHSGFLECFLNQPLDDCSVMYYCNSEKETRDHVNLDEWLDVWGKLLETARALDDLPLWLQYFPKIIFQVINKSGSQKISKEELRAFYTMFLGIDFRVVNETLDSIYNAMTDNGKNPITYRLFKLCFANFLLGRYPHGPGQFLFGICSPQSLHCNFPIDYSAMNTPADDLEPYDPNKDKDHSRRSVIV